VQADARVEDGVEDVDEQVRHDDPGRRDNDDTDDDRQVLLADRGDRRVAEAGQAFVVLDAARGPVPPGAARAAGLSNPR
jgi:hypothetical protein